MTDLSGPRFSIVIPCYNQGPFVHECLESVLSQTWPAHEIVVVDDGSTDPWTVGRLDRLCVSPVKLVRQENRGLSGARNAGVSRATGEWIIPLDADDRLSPDALASYAEAITSRPDVDIWYPDIQFFGNSQDLITTSTFNRWRQLWLNQLVCSAAIRRKVFDSGILFNERMRSGYEDWEFYVHACCEADFTPARLGRPVFLYRKWGHSMLSEADALGAETRRQLQAERPIYGDGERLLELKRRWSPFFAIASRTPRLEAALAGQTFRDWRLVDDAGGAWREKGLRVFQEGLGQSLLVSFDDTALASAFRADPFLLEKAARTAFSCQLCGALADASRIRRLTSLGTSVSM